MQQAAHGANQLSAAQLRGACTSRLQAPWSGVAHAHLSAVCQLAEGQLDAAASAYNSDAGPHLLLVDAINAEPDDLGLAAAFERAMGNARQLADAADGAAAAAGGKGGKVEQCGSQLQQAISRMGLPKGDGIAGKRRAHLALVCMLLRVYFRLNNIQGCTQVARTITNIYGQRNSDAIDLRVRLCFGGRGQGGRAFAVAAAVRVLWCALQARAWQEQERVEWCAGSNRTPTKTVPPPRSSPRCTASPFSTSWAAPSCTTKMSSWQHGGWATRWRRAGGTRRGTSA